MICHTKKMIFIHIPKCGGTSISSALSLEVHGGGGHNGWVGHKKFVNENYFTFSFVRNPWDRIVSLYFYFFEINEKHKWWGQNKEIAKYVKELTFKQFCERLDELQKNALSGIHFIPAHKFLENSQGKINLDYIGRFENLQGDFNAICNKVNIPNQTLPHANKSKHEIFTEYYDDETIEIVAKKYKKDIEYFGYEFKTV